MEEQIQNVFDVNTSTIDILYQFFCMNLGNSREATHDGCWQDGLVRTKIDCLQYFAGQMLNCSVKIRCIKFLITENLLLWMITLVAALVTVFMKWNWSLVFTCRFHVKLNVIKTKENRNQVLKILLWLVKVEK